MNEKEDYLNLMFVFLLVFVCIKACSTEKL